MVQTILIGLGAGLAAALLFLAPLGGSFLAMPLFILTGLPLAIAGLGWGPIAGVVAAVAGAVIIFAIVPTSLTALVFVLVFAVPVVWLTRLIGFSREGATGGREWYPTGRILLHATLVVSLCLVAVGFLIGYQRAAMVKDATDALLAWLAAAGPDATVPTAAEIAPVMGLYVALLPLLVGLMVVAITVFDLWLAALVARASGRILRPAERLWTVLLPNEILIGVAVAGVLAFLPGAFGEIASVFAGAFACGLVLVGLAVLHAVTVGTGGRAAILTLAYVLILFSGLPIVLFALLGAGETFLHLRARRIGRPTKT